MHIKYSRLSSVFSSGKQAGLTLVEVIVSLAILSGATIGISQIADRYSKETTATVAASQMRTVGEATKAYIKDNYAAIQLIADVGATPKPVLIDVPTLIAAGKLPVGFLATNAYGQSMCTMIHQPIANRLQAMVIAEGGTAVEDLTLGTIASTIGGSGGAVYAAVPAVMRGAIGGWTLATTTYDNQVNNLGNHCDGTKGNVSVTAGHSLMALWFENGDTSSTFLSRDVVPNRPDLNSMNTPLVMNSVQVVGGACTTSGAIAQDGSGAIVSCQGGSWKPATSGGGACVATTSDLDNLQTDGRCYNGVALPNSPAGGDWVFAEVFRHYNAGVYYVAQRVIGMTGAAVGRVWQRNQQSATAGGGWSAWAQQADGQVGINAGGNVVAAGAVTAAQGRFSQDGVATCCAPSAPTLAVSEASSTTGKKPNIQFHEGGISESQIALEGGQFVMKNGANTRVGLLTGNYSTQADNWALIARNAAGVDNANPVDAIGSAYLNDIYVRSVGKWVSQIATTSGAIPTAERLVEYAAGRASPVISWPGSGIVIQMFSDGTNICVNSNINPQFCVSKYAYSGTDGFFGVGISDSAIVLNNAGSCVPGNCYSTTWSSSQLIYYQDPTTSGPY